MKRSKMSFSGEKALDYFMSRVLFLYDEDPTDELIKKFSRQYGDDHVIEALRDELDLTPEAFRYADETESISFRNRLERNLKRRCDPEFEWLRTLNKD